MRGCRSRKKKRGWRKRRWEVRYLRGVTREVPGVAMRKLRFEDIGKHDLLCLVRSVIGWTVG